MKIDMALRDIELLLLLLQESVEDKIEQNNPDILTIEEFALLEKLENALRSDAVSDHDLFDMKVSTVYH